jgi:hypothetical protein
MHLVTLEIQTEKDMPSCTGTYHYSASNVTAIWQKNLIKFPISDL